MTLEPQSLCGKRLKDHPEKERRVSCAAVSELNPEGDAQVPLARSPSPVPFRREEPQRVLDTYKRKTPRKRVVRDVERSYVTRVTS